jgi:hypothetical protein
MGIARGAYRLLLEEKKRGVLKGETILQLGRQSILFGEEALHKYAKQHGVALSTVEPQLSFDPHYRQLGFVDDITLFKSLGFKNVHSLDYSNFEGADILWDLNQPIPEKYWGQFNVIYDGGTAEHVFHFPQLLNNIHLLLKEGGIIIHASPSNNHVDHGFYMYSPQIYSDYYSANLYSILTSQIIEYSANPKRSWSIYSYRPGMLQHLSYGNFGKRMLLIHLVAQKTSQSTSGIPPQQGGYLQAWNAEFKKKTRPKKRVDPLTRLGISLKKKLRKRGPFFLKRYIERRGLKKIATY